MGQNLVLTDEAMADIEAECTVEELDDQTVMGMLIGSAELRRKKDLLTIVVKAPIYMKDDEMHLAECYRNSIDIATANGVMSIAFPPISSGMKCFPKKKAAHIAVLSVQEWIKHNPDRNIRIYLVPEDQRIFDCMLEENVENRR